MVPYRIARWKAGATAPERYDTFVIEVDPDKITVLDGIEKIWAEQDRSLVFRHACHHASCGTCTVRVNGIEKLPCITSLRSVLIPGQPVVVEPLCNFPVIADLAFDPTPLYQHMEQMHFSIIRHAEKPQPQVPLDGLGRFENCIECGACLSACPIAGGDALYLGPAPLAAGQRMIEEPRNADVPAILHLIDTEHGVWRCHTAYACTEVCPSNVHPAEAIMALRKRLILDKVMGLFGIKRETSNVKRQT